MKYILLILIFTSCASTPTPKNRSMANCVHTKDNYFICEDIPAHVSGQSTPQMPPIHK